jgi:phage-related protein
MRAKALAGNKWYQLFAGVLMGVGDIDDKGTLSLNKCLPTTWAVDNAAKEGATDNADANAKSTLTSVLDFIEKVVDFVCKFKDKFVDLIKGKRFRRFQRLFFQNERTEIQKMLSWWNDILNVAKTVYNAAKDTVGKVVTTVVNGIETVGKWINKKWDDLKAFASQCVDNLVAWWTAFKTRAVAIFTQIKNAVVTIYNCVKVAKDIVKGIIDVVKGVADKIAKITRIAAGDLIALAEVFIDLFCNFGRFRKAFSALASGIENADVLKKYNFYGQFAGHLIAALTT